MFSSLRERTKAYIAKFGYRQNQIAEAIGVSNSHVADFLSARRGLSDITFAKLEHILSLNATQRKLQFYTGGNTGARMANLQSKGHNIKGQVKFNKIAAIEQTDAEFSNILERKLEV